MGERAPEKPTIGSPCNGCGYCCAASPCDIARDMIGVTEGPCPAMQFEDGRFWCGMVRTPSAYIGGPAFADEIIGRMVATALGVNRGCDADDFGAREDG